MLRIVSRDGVERAWPLATLADGRPWLRALRDLRWPPRFESSTAGPLDAVLGAVRPAAELGDPLAAQLLSYLPRRTAE
jgi:hypothetical protein